MSIRHLATNTRSRPRAGGVALVLFFSLWLIYGAFINSKNIVDYGQATVEAIVDQHRFYVEDLPVWTRGDDFDYQDHKVSNKQPGQAFICSVAYAQLRLLGISYGREKIVAGALVIFLTASFLTALAAAALFLLARDLDEKKRIIWPLAAALSWALGTTAFAYSGIAHHDAIATDFLIIAFFLLHRIRNADLTEKAQKSVGFLAGLLLGLTLTTSMLHFFMVSVFGIYFLTLCRWKVLLPLLIGGFLGVLPMLVYNTFLFGNPFLPPAMAQLKFTGDDGEVMFFLNSENFFEKLHVYYVQISEYLPVLWFGIAGLLFLPRKFRREQLFVAAAILALAIYVTNIQGLGTCAYGPRYLLPIMPFCALGIVGLGNLPTKVFRVVVFLALASVAAISTQINVVGAMMGAMFCNFAGYGYNDHVLNIQRGNLPQYPLLPYMVALLVALWAAGAFLVILRKKKEGELA
jgi:hypothetical protein